MELKVTIELGSKTFDVMMSIVSSLRSLSSSSTMSWESGSTSEASPAKSLKGGKSTKAKTSDDKPASKFAITLDDVKEAVKESKLKKAEIVEILKKYEVEKISDIPEDKLSDFVVDLGVN